MYSVITTAATHGIQSVIVQVEADVSDGMPVFEMVGILSSEVREAKERIKAAIRNTGFRLLPKKVTINLCPANIRKSGTGFDLPIALAVLTAYGYIDLENVRDIFFLGEIALSGEIRPVKGVLPMVIAAKEAGFTKVVLPKENAKEAELVTGVEIFALRDLKNVLDFLREGKSLEKPFVDNLEETRIEPWVDFGEINGQQMMRRACEVAVAGRHNILLVGPPGAGKSMVARALPGILPDLNEEEMLELTKIYSVSGLFEERKGKMQNRPFRSPHYSITKTALIGGGRVPEPGEITLAHQGVLFLDELTEYSKSVLEQLRQPLEEQQIRLVRMSGNYNYPADFMLVAAMNPCGCGYYPDRNKCNCSPVMIQRHLQKLSRPLLDRIDITVEVPRMKANELQAVKVNEKSEEIRKRVERVNKIQESRYQKEKFAYNSRIPGKEIGRFCPMEQGAKHQIETAYENLDLTARGYHKIIRVARTIADLANSESICEEHMVEALMYRSMDGDVWRKRI